jgi:hypothetical protein
MPTILVLTDVFHCQAKLQQRMQLVQANSSLETAAQRF